jgi:hypothetical protein
MMMMMALAASKMKPALDARRGREAARAINVFLGAARNTAMVTRRPCGVAIVPTVGIGQCGTSLQQLETPPPYAGDDASAMATIQQNVVGGTYQVVLGGGAPWQAGGSYTPGLVNNGDMIQFNGQGPWYLIAAVGANGALTVTLSTSDVYQCQIAPWTTTASVPMPYQINRMPQYNPSTQGIVVKSVVVPLQLPAGSVIDLTYSGIDPGNPANCFRDYTDQPGAQADGVPVYIVFSPSGSVQTVAYTPNASGALGSTQIGPVSTPIFLLVGKPDKARNLSTATPPLNYNYGDLENIWVVINPQTGLVSTAPVAAGGNLYSSRNLARDAQNMGGR